MKTLLKVLLPLLLLCKTSRAQMGLTFDWGKVLNSQTSGTGESYAMGTKTDPKGNIYVCGNFNGTCDFDPSIGVAPLTSNGSDDIFLAKYSPAGTLIFAKNIGGVGLESVHGLAIGSDTSIYIAGAFNGTADFDPGTGVQALTSVGGLDIYIAKYDVNGNCIFAKRIGGSINEDAFAIGLDATDNIHISGAFSGTCDFDPGVGVVNMSATGNADDMYIAKYTSAGVYIYARAISGTLIETGNTLDIDASGNLYVAGSFTGAVDFDPTLATAMVVSNGDNDGFLAKYSPNGTYIFAFGIGSVSYDAVTGIALDANANICVTGIFANTVDFDPGIQMHNVTGGINASNIFIAKYTSTGSFVFAKPIAGNSSQILFAESIGTDAGGNIYVSGYFNGIVDFDASTSSAIVGQGVGVTDIFLVKYTSAGNYDLVNNIGRTGTAGHGDGRSLTVDKDDNVIVTGGFMNQMGYDPADQTKLIISSTNQYNAPLLKYSATGNCIWGGNIAQGYNGGGADGPVAVATDASGNVVVAGYFAGTLDFDPNFGTALLSSVGTNSNDIFIAKYDAAGNYLFAKRFGGSGSDLPTDMKVDATGNIYVTGIFTGTVDFDPSVNTFALTSAGSTDVFVAKYNTSGNFVYAIRIGGPGIDNSAKLMVDFSGSVYVVGDFDGTVDFDPGIGVANRTSTGLRDVFFARYDATGGIIYAKNIGGPGDEAGEGIAMDANGNVVIAGSFSNSANFDPNLGGAMLTAAGSADAFFAKYDPSTNFIFAKRIGGNNFDQAMEVAVDAANNIVLTGEYYGSADFDPGAGTAILTSLGANDVFVSKYNASGNYIFAKSIGGTLLQRVNSLVLNSTGDIYIAGDMYGTVDFDPGVGVAALSTPNTNSDGYIAKYDAQGNYRYAHNLGGTGADLVSALLPDGSGGVYILGSIQQTVDFDFGMSVSNKQSVDVGDVFFAHYMETLVNIDLVNPTLVCAGSNISVSYTTAGDVPTGNYTLQLSDASGSFATPVVLATFPAAAAGTVNVTIPANSITSGQYKLRIVHATLVSVYNGTLTINAISGAPSVVIASNAQNNTTCAGDQVTFTATPTNGGLTPFYQWMKNGVGVVGISSNVYVDNGLLDGDVITCILTSSNNCVTPTNAASNAIKIKVMPLVTASVSIVSNAPGELICHQSPITFTATTVNPGTLPIYEWFKNNTSVGGVTTPTFVDNAPWPGDVVYCKMTSSEMCATPPQAQSNSLVLVPKTVVSITTTASPDSFGCEGKEIIFSSHFTNGGNSQHYQWMKNGVDVIGDTFTTYKGKFSNGDIINCRFYSGEPCAFPTISKPVTLHLNPQLPVSATIIGVPVSDGIMFHSQVTNGGTSPVYQWLKNNADIVGETGNSYYGKGLQWNDKISLRVGTNAVCPNADYVLSNGLTVPMVTGISSLGNEGAIKLYPNPNNGSFQLKGLLPDVNTKALGVEVYNALGQIVYKQEVSVHKQEIDISVNLGGAAAGVYMVKLHAGEYSRQITMVIR